MLISLDIDACCVFVCLLNGFLMHVRARSIFFQNFGIIFIYFKIVLSLFVAVILDNLELEEDVKKIKQVN